jgi:putative transcriptional regulator
METRPIPFRSAAAVVPFLLLGMPPGAGAQSVDIRDLHTGRVLVAARNFPDPTFAESVILLTQYSEQGAMGFILNRQTTVPVARAVPGASGSDPVYSGGPVSLPAVYGLLRSPSQLAQGKLVLGDIYAIMERELLEKTLSSKVPADRFHAYLGYCGWGPGQLDNEVKRGAWFIFFGRADMVFDAEPDSLWGRLIGLTDHQIARANLPRR